MTIAPTTEVVLAKPAPPIELPEAVYQLIHDGHPRKATQMLAQLLGTTEVSAELRIERWWRQQMAKDR